MSSHSVLAPLVVALDIGTSSVRALVFDSSGRKVGDAVQIPYEQNTTNDGGVEIGADFLLSLAEKCLDDLLPTIKGEISAIGISCFWHSLMAVDESGTAQTAVLSWADNRAAAWVDVLRATMDEIEAHARLGCVFHTSFWPAKLLWLRDCKPELFGTSKKLQWLGFGEFLRLKWCDDSAMSLSMASGTGLFNQNAADFDNEMLSHLPISRENLPDLCDLENGLELSTDLKNRWPQLKNAKIFPAIGDGACSNIGSGCANETKIGLNAGTSGALRVVLRDFTGQAPRGLWRYRIDKNRSIVGGALSNVGNLLVWARETFNIPEDWQGAIASVEPDSHGLTVLPFLAGERAPIWNGEARFVLSGANLNTDTTQILRAVAESAALRFAAVGTLLLELAPNAEIVFSGGALEKVPVWQPIVCDAIGANLTQSKEHEASARGAALLALESLGVVDDAANVPFDRGGTLEPNVANHAIYQRALERQNTLYEKTK
jgi:gluconokinase